MEQSQDQVIPQGNQDQSLGWRAALPDEYKEHEFVKTFQKPGDFVKTALEIKTEHDSLKTKMENALFKPGENSTPDEVSAFYKALGTPDKPEDYEIPKPEGMDHSPDMEKWARETFHNARLNKDQAAVIAKEWNGFIKGLADSESTAKANELQAAQENLKKEWGAEYDKELEFTKRGLAQFNGGEFASLLDDPKIGNHPVLIKLFNTIGKKIGEDSTLQGKQSGDKLNVGIQYKVPNPNQ